MSLTWRGMKEYSEKIRYIKNGLKELVQIVRDVTLGAQRDARSGVQVDQGILRASIQAEIITRDTVIKGVTGSNLTYAVYAEEGTRAHWPPPGALAGWARRHGIPEFLVARSIARKGTKGRWFIRKAFEKWKPIFQSRIDELMKRLVSKK